MIRLRQVSKSFRMHGGKMNHVLKSVDAEFPTGRNIGIFGLNGAGKSTLIKLLAGAEHPDSGSIDRVGMVSFPLGFDSVFHPNLTGRENIKFISRIYGVEIKTVMRYVEDFSELGAFLDNPIGDYSSGMRAKFAFGVCLAMNFDTYLIDEITEVGDFRFRQKALSAFRERALVSDIIVVSHNIDTIKSYCDMGAVLHQGNLSFFDSVDDAARVFRRLAGSELSS
jgi:capsular polysaccharide transport system ATP-binding protein